MTRISTPAFPGSTRSAAATAVRQPVLRKRKISDANRTRIEFGARRVAAISPSIIAANAAVRSERGTGRSLKGSPTTGRNSDRLFHKSPDARDVAGQPGNRSPPSRISRAGAVIAAPIVSGASAGCRRPKPLRSGPPYAMVRCISDCGRPEPTGSAWTSKASHPWRWSRPATAGSKPLRHIGTSFAIASGCPTEQRRPIQHRGSSPTA